MSKWDEWLLRVAGMERPDLVAAFQEEAKLREKALRELEATRAAAERDKKNLQSKLKAAHHAEPIVLIGTDHRHCEVAQRRMGLNPNRCKFIYTHNIMDNSPGVLYGFIFKPEQIRLVRGWSQGRDAREIVHSVSTMLMKDSRQVGWDALAYAPDPYDEGIL